MKVRRAALGIVVVLALVLSACGGGTPVDTSRYEAQVTPVLNAVRATSTEWENLIKAPKFEDEGWKKEVLSRLDLLSKQAQQLRGTETLPALKSVADNYNKAADELAVFVSNEQTAMAQGDTKLILSATDHLSKARGFIQNGNLLLERAKQGK